MIFLIWFIYINIITIFLSVSFINFKFHGPLCFNFVFTEFSVSCKSVWCEFPIAEWTLLTVIFLFYLLWQTIHVLSWNSVINCGFSHCTSELFWLQFPFRHLFQGSFSASCRRWLIFIYRIRIQIYFLFLFRLHWIQI